MAHLRNRLIVSFLFGFLVLVVLALIADVSRLSQVLADFTWAYLPAILALTAYNYILRFFKWHYYLGQIGVKNMRLRDSAIVFVAGFTMAMTPGKLGELFKAYALKQMHGVAISSAAPVVMAERLTDGFATVILALIGVTLYRPAWPFVIALVALMIGGVIVVQVRPLSLRLLDWAGRLPLMRRFIAPLRNFYESSYQLLKWRNLTLGIAIGVLSWSGESIAFYLVLSGLGLGPAFPPDLTLLQKGVFILAIATLTGAVTALPGGLGAADLSITGLMLALVLPSQDIAVAATLIIRFCTLWFGVSLGILTLLIYRRRFFQSAVADSQSLG